MALKDEWKQTGRDLGGAFADLGKTLLKTAKVGVEKADSWAEGTEDPTPAVNVTNDGTWRETGKELGGALAGLGKTLLQTAQTGLDKVDDWAEDEKK